ncbi:tripartite tricarboxylate transporter substrate binding protein [Ramlibacter sp. 2FC]|uniref:Bug family tripartite tricarboxylate transporter substrate binding protein n=1 Tax=Ramlibacter sp. 2FC TaxID=2502188 RepID=UPI0010F6330B|nr:tripartite tricarboxylate transporter substrate binding protein [Ramlibacter sp. 2FC]
MTRRRIFSALASAAAAASLFAASAVNATDYPVKPITVVVGYPAGGPTDVLMRAIGPRLTSDWKQPVIIDNRPGANEAIAAQQVSKAPADGHTLLLSTEVPLTQNQFLFRKLNYNPEKDFAPITRLVSSPLVLVVNPSVPANSIEEFVALARSRAAARPVSYASAGNGGVLHLPMAMLAKQNGLNMIHVPYKGVAPLLTDLVSGQVEAAWVAVAGAAPYVHDGRLKALVVDAPMRVKALPQVPVFSETKVAPVQADFNFVLQAPAGTPVVVVEKLADAIRKVLNDPEFQGKYLEPFGFRVVGSTPAELADFLAKDRPRQAERIKTSGASMD